MSTYVCSRPGCPTISGKPLCPEHEAQRNRALGPRKSRGYGPQHDKLRRAWRRKIDTVGAVCSRCGDPLRAGDDFDLDHTDDRAGYRGPSCVACNRGNR